MGIFDFFSKKRKQSVYQESRLSLSMDSASENDYLEYVAWLIIFNLNSKVISDECKRFPTEQRHLFMMGCAAYLVSFAKKIVEIKFPPNSWQMVSPLLTRELSKQAWHDEEVMNQLLVFLSPLHDTREEFLAKFTPEEIEIIKAKNLFQHKTREIMGGWPEIIMAVVRAGMSLDLEVSPKFYFFLPLAGCAIMESINEVTPHAWKNLGA